MCVPCADLSLSHFRLAKHLTSFKCKKFHSHLTSLHHLKYAENASRYLLASRAFSSRENTQLLNDITHPWIFLRSLKIIKEKINEGERLFVFDAPVLFESNSDVMCDLVACVTADRETRISRIINRDKITREAAQRRLSAQHSDSFYTSQSDFVVNGTGDMEYLSSMALMIKRKALSLKGGD